MTDVPRRRAGKRGTASHTQADAPTSAESTARDSDASPADDGASPQQGRPRRTARVLADGRVQMLVYLPPTLVKAVKRIALDDDTSASAVVERALAEWLARRTELPS